MRRVGATRLPTPVAVAPASRVSLTLVRPCTSARAGHPCLHRRARLGHHAFASRGTRVCIVIGPLYSPGDNALCNSRSRCRKKGSWARCPASYQSGAPGKIRTCCPLVRSEVVAAYKYPVQLIVYLNENVSLNHVRCVRKSLIFISAIIL